MKGELGNREVAVRVQEHAAEILHFCASFPYTQLVLALGRKGIKSGGQHFCFLIFFIYSPFLE